MIRNSFKYQKSRGEVNNEPSLTIPGQSQSVAEMLARVNNGFPVGSDWRLEWDDEEFETPMPKVNDLTDVDDIKMSIADTKRKIKEQREKAVLNKSDNPQD